MSVQTAQYAFESSFITALLWQCITYCSTAPQLNEMNLNATGGKRYTR